MLTRANLTAAETVLITGASGGVDSAAVQLAKRRGAKVIAIAGAAKTDQVLALGADRVIPRGAELVEALGEKSIDVVVDLVAGEQWQSLLELLKPRGALCRIRCNRWSVSRVGRTDTVLEGPEFFGLHPALKTGICQPNWLHRAWQNPTRPGKDLSTKRDRACPKIFFNQSAYRKIGAVTLAEADSAGPQQGQVRQISPY